MNSMNALNGLDEGGLLAGLAPDHRLALLAVLLVPPAIWLCLRVAQAAAAHGNCLARRFVRGYAAAPGATRGAAVLLLVTATIHLALVPGHARENPELARAFLLNGALFIAASLAAFTWRWWRPAAALLIVATIVAYFSAIGRGQEAPDQLGVATKLVELLALGLLILPGHAGARVWVRRLRWAGAAVAVLLCTTLTGLAALAAEYKPAAANGANGEPTRATLDIGHIGAQLDAFLPVTTAGPAAAHGQHHNADHPEPGMMMQPPSAPAPTPAQRAAAAQLVADTAAGIARYADVRIAIADGYRAATAPRATTVHYTNPAYMKDGSVLDPTRPEALVYANTRHGPVLLGAMYMMPKVGQRGPDFGGAVSGWHLHDNVCFTLGPRLAGILSPFGSCPIGSLNGPTPEMLHIWTAGNPNGPFGEPDKAWLAQLAAR